jgi:hypothetical protein
MKKLLLSATLLALSAVAAAQDVGVSIDIGQPGFYGRIDIGNTRPPVIYREPVIVQRPARYVEAPLYLRVPPGHAKHWSKHCRAYRACGRNVYFVKDSWYLNDYAPRYRARHDHGGPRHEVRHDRHDDRGHGNGHGNGKGHGNGNGHGNGSGHGRGHGCD